MIGLIVLDATIDQFLNCRRDQDWTKCHFPKSLALISWTIRKQDIKRAVQKSPSFATSPDGIPFCAWRKLGNLAYDTLYNVMQDLMKEDAEDRLNEAYSSGADHDRHEFNLSVMVFLPKKASRQHRRPHRSRRHLNR